MAGVGQKLACLKLRRLEDSGRGTSLSERSSMKEAHGEENSAQWRWRVVEA